MNDPSNRQWEKAHYGHDIHAQNETARRAGEPIRTSAFRPSQGNRALYGYDHGASDLRVEEHLGRPAIVRNSRTIATVHGPDAELDAALLVQASAMRNALIDVLSGSISHADIHALLQRATLKR